MISTSAAYKAAIIGDTRRIYLKAIIDILDPDITWGTVTYSGKKSVADAQQVQDRVFALDTLATLEHNRWLLDGSFLHFPLQDGQEAGYIGSVLSGDDGAFSSAVWVQENFSNVSILQAFSIYFPDADWDGYPVDFTVQVLNGSTVLYTQTVIDNTKSSLLVTSFTVNNPTAIKVTITKWSLPGRLARIVEIVPGVYEEWDGDMFASFSVKQQGDVSCTSLPYGTCKIKMDNSDRRFEPRNKDGIFLSIEERQAIPVKMGCLLADGSVEYVSLGTFYQQSGGWTTGDYGLTMEWDLVDIIGLLSDREFITPSTLPTTLTGWASALVGQLGDNFTDRYLVADGYESKSLVLAGDIDGKKCSDIIKAVALASGTWPHADAETGYLSFEPLPTGGGNTITLDNLEDYPTIKSNEDIAAITFTLADEEGTKYVVSGDSESASKTVSISNPFITTTEQADAAAAQILAISGGNEYSTKGRGDPSSEIGDVETLYVDSAQSVQVRRIQQNLAFSSGVLKGCSSTFLQIG